MKKIHIILVLFLLLFSSKITCENSIEFTGVYENLIYDFIIPTQFKLISNQVHINFGIKDLLLKSTENHLKIIQNNQKIISINLIDRNNLKVELVEYTYENKRSDSIYIFKQNSQYIMYRHRTYQLLVDTVIFKIKEEEPNTYKITKSYYNSISDFNLDEYNIHPTFCEIDSKGIDRKIILDSFQNINEICYIDKGIFKNKLVSYIKYFYKDKSMIVVTNYNAYDEIDPNVRKNSDVLEPDGVGCILYEYNKENSTIFRYNLQLNESNNLSIYNKLNSVDEVTSRCISKWCESKILIKNNRINKIYSYYYNSPRIDSTDFIFY